MSELINRLKKAKWAAALIFILAAGVILVMYGSPERESAAPESEDAALDEYVKSLEAKVKGLISEMDGTGNVSVMITLEKSVETELARDRTYSDGVLVSEKNYAGGKGTVEVAQIMPKVGGVAVVCRGGSDPVLQERVISLVKALFGIPANRVFVSG